MYITHPVPDSFTIQDSMASPALSPETRAEVQRIWESEKALRPGLFNGHVFSLDRIEAGVAHGFMAEYAWYVAQLQNPTLYDSLLIRSLAVSGLVVASGHLIFGLRKASLAVEGGLWELAPSGTMDGALREPDGSISWRKLFTEELREELGIDVSPAMARPFGLIENTDTHIWELGIAAELPISYQEILAAFAASPSPEHTEMAAVPLADAARFYNTRKDLMVGATGPLLSAYGVKLS
ncbi:MAG: hypothetical protein HY795_14225 [Desulfovibrio sp.]|nr:hypothetical protein [Desulfovibrio sp.]MBI4959452.1 hypothetical protein [Desulfovibrio sp.]